MNSRSQRLEKALRSADQTRAVEIGAGILDRAADLFTSQFPGASAAVVADENTDRAAGASLFQALRGRGVTCVEPFIFKDPALYAEHRYVEQLQQVLSRHAATPVAVGSGTINDLVKLSSHRQGRPYMAVATAASMDGYTAFGASITWRGSKQTFDCPAPRAVLADLDVIASAPAGMTASGYADLLAKITAGADWIVADALGIEPIHPHAWQLVQTPLRDWVADPESAAAGQHEALACLVEGLMMSGLAMQASRSSRPASGAEHQFSHLWDMQHHTHDGAAPSHGFKVGIGTIAVAELYERLLKRDLGRELDIDACCRAWPDRDQMQRDIRSLFGEGELCDKAIEESSAKWISAEALAAHLARVKQVWPELVQKLNAHLLSAAELRRRLRSAGAPDQCEQIGIDRQRLRASHRLAYHIRRRYTVLDLLVRTRLLEPLLAGT